MTWLPVLAGLSVALTAIPVMFIRPGRARIEAERTGQPVAVPKPGAAEALFAASVLALFVTCGLTGGAS